MKKNYIFLLMAICLAVMTTRAQIDCDTTYRMAPFQFTFLFPPLSTNGLQYAHTVNQGSLNLFLGVSAGTGGVEVGSFVNINRLFMRGVQMAGFMNLVGIPGRTCQSHGVQMAGFGNITQTPFTGTGLAGFANIYTEADTGVFLAGFMNVAGPGSNSVQVAGFSNLTPQGNTPAQIAGFLNVADTVTGVQIAGFANVARKVSGMQIAGFINICDSIDGIPLGFINLVKKNGYHRFEIATTDYAFVQLSFKMGVRHFYNIYSVSKLINEGNKWVFGGGIGSEKDLGNGLLLNVELTVHQILWVGDPRTRWSLHIDRLNLLNQLKVALGKQLGGRTSVFLAPALNVSVATSKTHQLGPDFQPYWRVAPLNDNHRTRVRIWPGFAAGIRF